MGMYTSISDSSVEIIDMDGLKRYIEEFKAGKYPEFIDDQELLEAITIDEENNTLDFQGMDGWKIISYWYDTFVLFLRDLAVFVEGTIYMSFETEDEGGRIEFENGKCIIHTGIMKWSENEADKFFKVKEKVGKVKSVFPPITKDSNRKWLGERLMARQI